MPEFEINIVADRHILGKKAQSLMMFQYSANAMDIAVRGPLWVRDGYHFDSTKADHAGVIRYLAKRGLKPPPVSAARATNIIKLLIDLGSQFGLQDAVRLGDAGFLKQCLSGKVRNFYHYPAGNDEAEQSAVSEAIDMNRADLVLIMVQAGAVTLTGKEAGSQGFRRPLIHMAASTGSIELLQLVIRSQPNSIHSKCHGLGPLHDSKDVATAKFLLQNGASINESGGYMATPIVSAISSSNLQLVKYYVQNGAEINFPFGMQTIYTPLSWAKHKGQTAIAEYLQSIGAKEKVDVVPDTIKSMTYIEEMQKDSRLPTTNVLIE